MTKEDILFKHWQKHVTEMYGEEYATIEIFNESPLSISYVLDAMEDWANQAPNIAYRQLCPKCLGEGTIYSVCSPTSLRTCPVCNGEKVLKNS